MRFENRSGMRLTIAMAAAMVLSLGWTSVTLADGYRLHHTIPGEVAAYDYTTGGEFMAPPVPYGHYAKNHVYDPRYLAYCVKCRMHSLLAGHGTGCGLCGGKGCGHCLNGGGLGHGGGILGHGGDGSACSGPGCDPGHGLGHHKAAGKFAPIHCGPGCFGHGSAATPVVAATSQSVPAGQAVVQPSSQYPCGQAGCGIASKHSHGKGLHRSLCGGCRGQGCGACGGGGMVGGCGDPGCGLCKGKGCGFCGGRGCSNCLSKLHGKLASLTGLFHHGPKVQLFHGSGRARPDHSGICPLRLGDAVASRLLLLPAHESVRSLNLNGIEGPALPRARLLDRPTAPSRPTLAPRRLTRIGWSSSIAYRSLGREEPDGPRGS